MDYVMIINHAIIVIASPAGSRLKIRMRVVSKRKRKTALDYYISMPIGTTHFLRSGSGAHVDRKKQANKKACRKRINPKEE